MNVIGLCGYSGAGKTTLVERLIPLLRLEGQRVSVLKHAHHDFDVDHVGKDSWRHREAGAFEVVIASDRRLAKMREYPALRAPDLHELIAELAACDWVLVEGFKHAALPKIEVWRAATGKPALFPHDGHVVAVATDRPEDLPLPTALPVFGLDDVSAIANFLMHSAGRWAYRAPTAVPPTANL
jgi:molybdopterin-guanine dinucleotide biosynthesis protein B